MRTLRKALLLTALALALPTAPAAAEEATEAVVPPGNSAVNQYTQTLPSASGGKGVDGEEEDRPVTGNEVLGPRNVKKLEQHGSTGEAVTEIVVETAPSAEQKATQSAPEPQRSAGSNRKDAPEPVRQHQEDQEEDTGGSTARPNDRGGNGPAVQVSADVEGESRLAAVLGEASGTSSGQLGLLLPLVIFGGLVWAIVFLARRPRQTGP